jgi:hypothetical protein
MTAAENSAPTSQASRFGSCRRLGWCAEVGPVLGHARESRAPHNSGLPSKTETLYESNNGTGPDRLLYEKSKMLKVCRFAN